MNPKWLARLCNSSFQIVILTGICISARGANLPIFQVQLGKLPSMKFLTCDVSFAGKLPEPSAVDKLVRDALQMCATIDSSQDIVAQAFKGDDALSSTQYSGPIVFKAALKKIITMDEERGVKTTT